MTPTSQPVITLDEVSFAWPDGQQVLTTLSGTFTRGATSLIGANGSGKTTLLRIMAGELTPTGGVVSRYGEVAYLAQHINANGGDTVGDLLGITPTLNAIRAIETGDTDEALFDIIGDRWDIESRAIALLSAHGLGSIALTRPVATLSGGEAVRIAMLGTLLLGADVTLLDEPTNNLDRHARNEVYDLVFNWSSTLIVVSHDVELLERVDATAELYDGRLTVYGGAYSHYLAQLEEHQRAAQRTLITAKQSMKREQQQRRATEVKLARRVRSGNKAHREKRAPKIVMNQRRAEAQVSAGKLRDIHDDRLAKSRDELDDAERAVRVDNSIRITLNQPELASTRRLVTLQSTGCDYTMTGPERCAVVGPNGVGKTTLVRSILESAHRGGQVDSTNMSTSQPARDDHMCHWSVTTHVRQLGYVPQLLDHLDDDATVLENVIRGAPDTSVGTIRAQLARFLFHGGQVDQPVGSLSGGERFRVAMAHVLLQTPPVELLILDEPTNNLDLDSISALVDSLVNYRGGLIIVSHDQHLIERLEVTTMIEMTPPGAAQSCFTINRL